MRLKLVRLACLTGLMFFARSPCPSAQTDEIQVYDAEIAAPGVFNLTWHNNYTPSGRHTAQIPEGVIPDHSLSGVPEWAYGVTDWFEAGLYMPLYSVTDTGALLLNGFKVRTLFVEPHAAGRTFIYGINFEYSYNAAHWDAHPYTLEIRPIIGWHLGPLDLIVNPILDSAYDGVGKLDFAPALRLAWNWSHSLAIAAEEYSDFGPLQHFRSHDAQSHTLFSVLDYRGGRMSVEAGVGFGLAEGADHRIIKLILSRDLNSPH